jgi:hypothetical protein
LRRLDKHLGGGTLKSTRGSKRLPMMPKLSMVFFGDNFAAA